MKKVLFVATVDSHIELFHLPYLKMFKDKGYEVHVATDSDKPIKYCDKKIKLPIKRSPFSLSNFKAIRELKKIVNSEKYEIVHCHTPMGGVVARLAAKKARKNGTRVIYTAHGFHFYKGAPLKNWLLFYPVEKRLAKFTDTLITINVEDFERAKKKFGKRCYDIQYVPGVGVDEKKFEKRLSAKEKSVLRKSLGLKDDDKVLIFPAELSKRKNQTWLIKTLKPLFDKDARYHLLLPGKDSMNGKCQKLANRLGLEKQVHFLGFRDDISELLQISDMAVSSAKQEGLPVNLMEAAFLRLPIVATDCRGNRDVCKAIGGHLVVQVDGNSFVLNVANAFKKESISKKCQDFELVYISQSMEKIYNFQLPGGKTVVSNEEKHIDLEKIVKKIKVSVCVPVYNAEEYIGDCLDSLLAQTLKDFEIICVDDGSTDRSSEILDEYAEKYENIKVVHQKNMGLGGARDAGVKNATGEFIGFVDADDLVDSRMYETLYDLAMNNSTEISFCNLDLFPKNINTNKKIWYNPYRGEISGDFLYRNTQPWNKIFSRKLFDRLNAKFEKNDCICALLMVEANGLSSTDRKLYHYRVGHSSMSSRFKINEFLDTVDMNDKIRNIIKNNNKTDADLDEYFDFLMIDSLIKTLAVSVLLHKMSIYNKYKDILKTYKYKENKYCKKLLKTEQGRLKYFAIINILPNSYTLSNFLIHFGLKEKLQ